MRLCEASVDNLSIVCRATCTRIGNCTVFKCRYAYSVWYPYSLHVVYDHNHHMIICCRSHCSGCQAAIDEQVWWHHFSTELVDVNVFGFGCDKFLSFLKSNVLGRLCELLKSDIELIIWLIYCKLSCRLTNVGYVSRCSVSTVTCSYMKSSTPVQAALPLL